MDFYSTTEMPYTEIAIALENYTYGKKGKFIIQSLLPLVKIKDGAMETITHLNLKNIENQDTSKITVDKCTESNYITLDVPLNLCPKCNGSSLPPHCIANISPSLEGESGGDTYKIIFKDNECDHKGKAGDKFIVTFVGGNINNPLIYRRY